MGGKIIKKFHSITKISYPRVISVNEEVIYLHHVFFGLDN